jgi:hypothetical protein
MYYFPARIQRNIENDNPVRSGIQWVLHVTRRDNAGWSEYLLLRGGGKPLVRFGQCGRRRHFRKWFGSQSIYPEHKLRGTKTIALAERTPQAFAMPATFKF